jgi:hypothetical protein
MREEDDVLAEVLIEHATWCDILEVCALNIPSQEHKSCSVQTENET